MREARFGAGDQPGHRLDPRGRRLPRQSAGRPLLPSALAVEGPPEAFAQEVERVQPLLDGFAAS